MNRRTCTACGVEKRLGDFYRHPRGPAGHETQCKACRREARIERHQTRGDAAREQQRRRYATDAAYRERKLAYWRAYVKTDAGRESRRITQRIARAFQRAESEGDRA